MQRINTSTAVADKFGAGKSGFTDGNPATGVQATALNGDFFDHVQEEIAGVIEATGTALDPSNYGQMVIAIQAMIAAAINALPPADALPVGAIVPCPSTTPWDGFYIADGSTLTRADDADLWAYAQASGNIVDEVDWSLETSGSFSRGDGASTFRLPDLRGVGLRGFDGGRGLDGGRVFGTYQADQMQQITGELTAAGASIFGPSTGAFSSGVSSSSYGSSNPGSGFSSVSFDNSNSPGARVGSETRMINTAVNFCIKY